MKKPAAKAATPEVIAEPEVVAIDLPEVGDIVISNGFPAIVTEVGETTFSAQLFGRGTERHSIEGASLGEQCQRKPLNINPKTKEA